jgi:ribosomal-protein-alanine N-acetyltransferase
MNRHDIHIRWMIRRDMPEVLAIEHTSFEFPWCEEEFLRRLRQRNCIGMVAEQCDAIIGHFLYEMHPRKLVVTNLAVAPDRRREGIGRAMVAKLDGKLSSHRRTRMCLVARESNLDAQLFLRACGFDALRVIRGHFDDTGEDGYYFVRRVSSPSPTNWLSRERLLP